VARAFCYSWRVTGVARHERDHAYAYNMTVMTTRAISQAAG
jgi:hypothetical protein